MTWCRFGWATSEAFGDDAHTAAKILNVQVTRRDRPMAGFPHHQLHPYLARLVKAGVRVAVSDPVEPDGHRAERIFDETHGEKTH